MIEQERIEIAQLCLYTISPAIYRRGSENEKGTYSGSTDKKKANKHELPR